MFKAGALRRGGAGEEGADGDAADGKRADDRNRAAAAAAHPAAAGLGSRARRQQGWLLGEPDPWQRDAAQHSHGRRAGQPEPERGPPAVADRLLLAIITTGAFSPLPSWNTEHMSSHGKKWLGAHVLGSVRQSRRRRPGAWIVGGR
jgi:hypothetical protein